MVTDAETSFRGSDDRSSAAAAATLAFLFLDSLILAQGVLAYRNQFLTVSQLIGNHITQGLPFIWHFGMWGDFFIVSPLAAYLMGRYATSWKTRGSVPALAIGLSFAALFSWLYTMSAMAETHVQNHHLTAAGVVHLFY